jgi:Domain of Unknown Function (DUF1259)
MRIKFTLCVSMLAMSIATSAPAQTIDWKIFAESFISSAHAQHGDWQKVDETLGRKPAITGDVSRYGFPRSDLTVTLDGVTIKPSLALGGWIAFKPMHDGPMVMGDLVLLETEINPVMTKLIEGPSTRHLRSRERLSQLRKGRPARASLRPTPCAASSTASTRVTTQSKSGCPRTRQSSSRSRTA